MMRPPPRGPALNDGALAMPAQPARLARVEHPATIAEEGSARDEQGFSTPEPVAALQLWRLLPQTTLNKKGPTAMQKLPTMTEVKSQRPRDAGQQVQVSPRLLRSCSKLVRGLLDPQKPNA
jgi:hypothetical protein